LHLVVILHVRNRISVEEEVLTSTARLSDTLAGVDDHGNCISGASYPLAVALTITKFPIFHQRAVDVVFLYVFVKYPVSTSVFPPPRRCGNIFPYAGGVAHKWHNNYLTFLIILI
jgi:hypothetical protein